MKLIIRDKINDIIKTGKYNFVGIDFSIFSTDKIRIYNDFKEANLLAETTLDNIDSIEEYLDREYKKSLLIKLPNDELLNSTFAVCFYLNAPEVIEGGIKMSIRYV